MFATPKPAPVPKPAPKQAPITAETAPTASEPTVTAEPKTMGTSADTVVDPAEIAPATNVQTPTGVNSNSDEAIIAANITPPKDDLTQDNLEHVPDTSRPKLTETSASTVASTRDIGGATPSASQQNLGRTLPGGFTTSAYRAAAAAQGRSASFQRKVMEQQEAVVMPGNHAVDRTAVQFGSMGLNGDPDSVDVDEDREEAETRTQPPQHSPTQQPRAALPPAPRQQLTGEMGMSENYGAISKQPGPYSAAAHQQPTSTQQLQAQQLQQQGSPPDSALGGNQYMGQQPNSQASAQYGQYSRYGQPQGQADASTQAQKPYDHFSQQVAQTGQYEALQSHGHLSNHSQHSQSQGHYSSAPIEQSYYASDYQRNPYQNYYGGSYGQQSAHQEAGLSQQRSTSGFGTSVGDSSYPSSQSQQQVSFLSLAAWHTLLLQ